MKSKHFYKISSADKPAAFLAEKIRSRLDSGQQVLWLVSGGSAVEVAVHAAEHLAGADVSMLSIGLVDERYGDVGHPDSNWQQLMENGFRAGRARLYPVLSARPIRETTEAYRKKIDQCLDSADFRIALLGAGADSHTAGILPGSPAIDAKESVLVYQGTDFVRITMTLKGLLRLDEAVVYAMGEPKRQALEILADDEDVPLEQYPIRVIRRIPEWSVYNDLLGEAI